MAAFVYHNLVPLPLHFDDSQWICSKFLKVYSMYFLVFKKRKLRVVTERSWLGLLSRPAAAGLWDAGLS